MNLLDKAQAQPVSEHVRRIIFGGVSVPEKKDRTLYNIYEVANSGKWYRRVGSPTWKRPIELTGQSIIIPPADLAFADYVLRTDEVTITFQQWRDKWVDVMSKRGIPIDGDLFEMLTQAMGFD